MRLHAGFWRIIAPRTLNAAGIPLPSIEPSRHDQSLQGRRSRELEFRGRRVSGTIIHVHMRDVEHKGYTHHANPDDRHSRKRFGPSLPLWLSARAPWMTTRRSH